MYDTHRGRVANLTIADGSGATGGAIDNFGQGTVTVLNATFSGNSVTRGGGTVRMTNNVVANSPAAVSLMVATTVTTG